MNKNTIMFGISVIGLTGLVFYLLLNTNIQTPAQQGTNVDNTTDSTRSTTDTPQGEDVEELLTEIITEGNGEEAKEGDTVTVHYTGTLLNGSKFDSSLDRDQPFSFTLGSGQVIQGWEQGVLGMKVGEVRKITIPSELGYGSEGRPPAIPGGSALVFEIELLSVE